MFKLSSTHFAAIVGLVFVVGFIAFLSLPKDVPDSRRLHTERLVKLTEVPQISFASPEDELGELTVEAIACPTGEIVATEEECSVLELEENETINCDGTIEDPVCGEDEITYLNSCYPEELGIAYLPGMCNTTGELIIDEYNTTDNTFENITYSGIGSA